MRGFFSLQILSYLHLFVDQGFPIFTPSRAKRRDSRACSNAAADPASDWCTRTTSLRPGRWREGESAGGVQPGTTLSLRFPGRGTA